jgi:hypothetical protein
VEGWKKVSLGKREVGKSPHQLRVAGDEQVAASGSSLLHGSQRRAAMRRRVSEGRRKGRE